jgi:hypothetical protein
MNTVRLVHNSTVPQHTIIPLPPLHHKRPRPYPQRQTNRRDRRNRKRQPHHQRHRRRRVFKIRHHAWRRRLGRNLCELLGRQRLERRDLSRTQDHFCFAFRCTTTAPPNKRISDVRTKDDVRGSGCYMYYRPGRILSDRIARSGRLIGCSHAGPTCGVAPLARPGGQNCAR